MLAEIVWNQNTIAVVGVFSVPIVAIVGHFWHQINRDRFDHELKHRMIERGMSADEIERILKAGSGKPGVFISANNIVDTGSKWSTK